MDILDFIASLIESLAWPVTLFLILFLFRKQVAGLLPLLRRLRYKDFELAFEKQVEEAQAKADREHLPQARELEDELDSLVEIAFVSPRAAILEAWLKVEAAAAEAVSRHGLELRGRERTPLQLGEALNRAEVIDRGILDVYEQLRDLRNKAVHGPEVTFSPSVVRDYISLALSLVDHLRRQRPGG